MPNVIFDRNKWDTENETLINKLIEISEPLIYDDLTGEWWWQEKCYQNLFHLQTYYMQEYEQ